MKAFKGFRPDMTCRGFQYEEGKEYETKEATLCENGFHACKRPLDVLTFYEPSNSVYHEVELDGKIDDDGKKVAATKIKIGNTLSISDLVKSDIEYMLDHTEKNITLDDTNSKGLISDNDGEILINRKYTGASITNGCNSTSIVKGRSGSSISNNYKSTSMASCLFGSSIASGDSSGSIVNGDYGSSISSGGSSISVADGYHASSITSGNYSISSAYGPYCSSISSGDNSSSVAKGYFGISIASGDYGKSIADAPSSVAIAWGYHSVAKGVIGSYLILPNWDYSGEDRFKDFRRKGWSINGAIAIFIDGEKFKDNTWYQCVNNNIIEVNL